MKYLFVVVMLVLGIASPSFATVIVTSPSNGATVGLTPLFAATATTSTCSKGVATMGVYVDNASTYVVNGTTLSTNSVQLAPGAHTVAIQEWDYCGGATLAQISVTAVNQSALSVVTPVSGSTVGSPVSYIASATTTCAAGISSMGIYVDGVLSYTTSATSIATQLPMSLGTHATVVKAWDKCGGTTSSTVDITAAGTTMTDLQSAGGWNQWGELPPSTTFVRHARG